MNSRLKLDPVCTLVSALLTSGLLSNAISQPVCSDLCLFLFSFHLFKLVFLKRTEGLNFKSLFSSERTLLYFVSDLNKL